MSILERSPLSGEQPNRTWRCDPLMPMRHTRGKPVATPGGETGDILMIDDKPRIGAMLHS
jgi:hypothetical protein